MFVKTLMCHMLLKNRYCLNRLAKTINHKVVPGVDRSQSRLMATTDRTSSLQSPAAIPFDERKHSVVFNIRYGPCDRILITRRLLLNCSALKENVKLWALTLPVRLVRIKMELKSADLPQSNYGIMYIRNFYLIARRKMQKRWVSVIEHSFYQQTKSA